MKSSDGKYRQVQAQLEKARFTALFLNTVPGLHLPWCLTLNLIEREIVAAPHVASRGILFESRPPVSRQKLELTVTQ